MHNCAIICEYNPFHTGHRYQIERARQLGAQNIICLMSGNFVQSTEPAFCDKSIRAKCAILGRADAVIEFPVQYATASAESFAIGAVRIISELRDVDCIAMGATADADVLIKLAESRIKLKDEYGSLIKSALKQGKSYNYANIKAQIAVYADLFGEPKENITEILSEPNNMLCVEYISAIKKIAPHIQPLIIHRESSYRDTTVSGRFISATAVRHAIDNNESEKVKCYVPFLFDEIVKSHTDPRSYVNAYKKCALFAVKIASTDYLSGLRDCSDGMEHLIKSLCSISDYDELCESKQCRNYGKKRIQRLLFDCLLEIKKEFYDYPPITRLLSCRNNFDFSILPEFVKTNNADLKAAASADKRYNELIGLEERAAALYSALTASDGGYFNYSLVKI